MTWPPGLNFESERLRFRPLAPEDLDLIVESWTDPEVIRFVDDRTYSEAELRDDMPMMTRRGGDGWIGAWAFASKETGEKFGTAA
ncbi:MAG: GNAT family N-acetyltransferase, partial [Pseudomonadota bacterium]